MLINLRVLFWTARFAQSFNYSSSFHFSSIIDKYGNDDFISIKEWRWAKNILYKFSLNIKKRWTDKVVFELMNKDKSDLQKKTLEAYFVWHIWKTKIELKKILVGQRRLYQNNLLLQKFWRTDSFPIKK